MIIIAVLIGCLKRNNSKAATNSNDIEMYWDDLAKRDAKSKQ